jgi:hypothetical protein
MLRILSMIFCVITTSTSASSAAEADEFSQHLVGCWQHGEIPPFSGRPEEVFMTQTCFEGGAEGDALYFTCHGFGTFDCWEGAERYALTGATRNAPSLQLRGYGDTLCRAHLRQS